jgi:hypothetical protein
MPISVGSGGGSGSSTRPNLVTFTNTAPAGNVVFRPDMANPAVSLVDLSGNGYDLGAVGGADYQRVHRRGLIGTRYDGRTWWQRRLDIAPAPLLLLRNGLTIQFLGRIVAHYPAGLAAARGDSTPDPNHNGYPFGAICALRDYFISGTHNMLWNWSVGMGSGTPRFLTYAIHRSVGRVDQIGSISNGHPSYEDELLTLTRSADGLTYRCYRTDVEFGNATVAAAPDASASPNNFYLFSTPWSGGYYIGSGDCLGFRIIDTELTAGQIADVAAECGVIW